MAKRRPCFFCSHELRYTRFKFTNDEVSYSNNTKNVAKNLLFSASVGQTYVNLMTAFIVEESNKERLTAFKGQMNLGQLVVLGLFDKHLVSMVTQAYQTSENWVCFRRFLLRFPLRCYYCH